MAETIELGNIEIRVTRKDVKNVHLTVHPPNGRVTLTAPINTRLEVVRAYAITRLDWIRRNQQQLRHQARETPRQFVERESHYLWGRRYLLTIEERGTRPSVRVEHRRVVLTVRSGSNRAKRQEVIHDWHKGLLHQFVRTTIEKWQPKLGVSVRAYFLQRMKTKWGSCNHRAGHIRLNTELVKKPKDLAEYVIAHEMVHLLEPTHNESFIRLLTFHLPSWRESRAELNGLPLTSEVWKE